MKTYKGFNKDMTCNRFQYEVGKEYEENGTIEVCKKGFHACEYPLDCFNYYTPSQSVFHEVEQSGELSKAEDDTKVASSKIKIGAELNIAGLVRASVEYVKKRADKSKGNHSRAKKRANSATGARSANSATGDWSANISTGIKCKNSGEGGAIISVGWGKDNKCKGTIGNNLVLSEWGEWDGEKYPLLSAQMIMVDGEKYKENTFYMLKNGELVEVEE